MSLHKPRGVKLSHLNALRAFEATARHQSFSVAAAELDVTPAAVSQLVKRIEHLIGAPLFNRAKGGSGNVTLTPAGQMAYPDISAGFRLIQSGLGCLRRMTDEAQLSIAASPAFASKWLIPKLGDFRTQHPDIEVVIHTNSMKDDYISNNIDLGIRYGTGAWDNLSCVPLMDEYTFPVCSPHYLTTLDLNTSPLHGATLIHDLSLDGHSDFPCWERWLGEKNLVLLNSQAPLKINNSAAVLQACAEGHGLALARSMLVEDDVQSGRLVAPFGFSLNKLKLGYYIVHRAGFENVNKIRVMTNWLKFKALQTSSSYLTRARRQPGQSDGAY